MILVIDNYDSFTYNLVQYLGELGGNPIVYRNDKITIERIKKLKPKYIIVSPGPGMPKDAGISNKVIKAFSGKIPILGVCLGHQCVGEVFGSKIVGAKRIMHGKTSQIYHAGKGIFKNVKNPFEATRYHSLIVDKKSMDMDLLDIIARTKQGEIMGIKHKAHQTWGVQFHPESIMTKEGKKVLKNFLELK
ncbi:MAG: aminodeoxychorismate/anthranilate synthase component II [Candidatus Omnitrophica bacterium]|nr:aminodeoxychorismate/anthranilate synthase component II [Candidatus Omnitrophota bacterium]